MPTASKKHRKEAATLNIYDDETRTFFYGLRKSGVGLEAARNRTLAFWMKKCGDRKRAAANDIE